MLKHLAEKMRVWRNKVTPETTAEIKELVQAADAGVKAQYWEHTHGADSETGAAKAAEKAIVDAGQFADLQTKQMVAKKASVAYLEKEQEIKRTIKLLSDAKKLTGPIDKNASNKYLSGVTERIRKMIQEQAKETEKPKPFEKTPDTYLDEIEARMTGTDPFTKKMKDESNPFLLDSQSGGKPDEKPADKP